MGRLGALARIAATSGSRSQALLDGPILPTLVTLALPNILALGVQSIVAIAETSYLGRIGTEALAAMALVFPMIMLTQMMSSGAIGGGVSSAISRALGAGEAKRAEALALHALIIGLSFGLTLSSLLYLYGPWIYLRLGGTGNMRLPSTTIIVVGICQIVLGASLSLGFGPVPKLGIRGVAIGQVVAHAFGALFLVWRLTRHDSKMRLGSHVAFVPEMFRDILKVGAVACLSPIQAIFVVILQARIAAQFGTEALAGFGIGIRLELLLVPIAFAIGVACVPMVGMSIGADRVPRARRVAWTGALLSGCLIGSIGLMIAWKPHLWGRLFTSADGVIAASNVYLGIAGFGFPAYGMGLCLYFASQGSGKILGPVLAGTVRLAVVLAGGWWLAETHAGFPALAWLVTAGMVAYGTATALFVWLTRWGKG